MKHDCILINPRSIYFTKAQSSSPYLYAGLLSVGSLLDKRGWKTTILDMVVEENPVSALKKASGGQAGGVPLIGLSVMTSQVPHAIELSRHIRREYPDSVIVWGGIHSSLFPEDVLGEGVADYVCVGEGEQTALELLEALKQGSDTGAVAGLYYRKGEECVFTGRRPPAALDELPYFNYDLVEYERYRNRNIFRGSETAAVRFGVVLTGFGCPYRCAFCINTNKKLHLGKYRRKSAGRIVDEIEHLMKKHGIDFFDFIDENFFVNRRHVEDFIAEVERRKLTFRWFTNMRADALDRGIADGDMLRRLSNIGLYNVAIGAESGSQPILDKLKKDIAVEQIYQSAALLSASGIGATCSFMMGVPGERREDLLLTLALIRRLRSCGRTVAIIGPQIFRPYPGGELFEECITKYHYKYPKSLSEWSQSVDILSGFENIEKLTWIEDPEFLKRISFYIEFINLNISALKVGRLKKAALLVMKTISSLRLRYQFWSFTFDMDLILHIKNLRRK